MVAWMHDLTADRRQRTAVKDKRTKTNNKEKTRSEILRRFAMRFSGKIFGILFMVIFSVHSFAKIGLGADVVSRYIWRGTDLGGSVSVQPVLSYTAGLLEVGAWGSYSLTDRGANENDLYLTYSLGELGITVTDYYFPETMDVFDYSSDAGIHWIEASLCYTLGKFSLLTAFFFSGDPEDSKYFELTYNFYENEAVSASLIIGAGDGVYLVDSERLNIVNIGLKTSSGPLSVSYILNPQAETNFLVFGYSF